MGLGGAASCRDKASGRAVAGRGWLVSIRVPALPPGGLPEPGLWAVAGLSWEFEADRSSGWVWGNLPGGIASAFGQLKIYAFQKR